MSRPSKPYLVLQGEKKSHRTKSELLQRKEGEAALASGTAFKERAEVKNNKVAHKEFMRVKKLLKGIDKNDALYEPIINRYCMIQAECVDLETRREQFYELTIQLQNKFDETIELTPEEEQAKLVMKFGKEMSNLAYTMIDVDKQIQSKRRMLLDIEKECVMTIASALRSIPKKQEDKKNALLQALGGD